MKFLNHSYVLIGIVAVVLVLLLSVYMFVFASNFGQETADSRLLLVQDRAMEELLVQDVRLSVEVVTAPESIRQGLSGRSEIGSDGMFFVFAQPQSAIFWMLDMRFPLDFVWILDGKIVGITPEVPAPKLTDTTEDLTRYGSPGLVDAVLEVPAGTAQMNGWNKGAAVQLLPKQ